MKKTYKKALIFFLSLIATASFATASYAYFKLDSLKSPNKNIGTDITVETVIGVADFDALYRNSQSSAYNDSASVSDSSERRILRLTADITLPTDLIATADCHIDLNGKTLFLNGYSLTVSHGYAGSFLLYGGVVVPDKLGLATGETPVLGKIYVDTPFAAVLFDGVTFQAEDGTEYTESTATKLSSLQMILSADNKFLGYNVFSMVSGVLADAGDTRPSRLDYSAISGLSAATGVSETNGKYVFDSALFLQKRSVCYTSQANGKVGTDEICNFVSRDIDLPFTYQSYGNVTVSYESTVPDILNAFGKVVLPTSETDVTLTATVLVGGAPKASCSFSLHVIGKDAADLATASKTLVSSYLQKYYDSASGRYLFNREIYLPSAVADLGVTVGYSAYKTDAAGSGDALVYADNFSAVTDSAMIKFQPTVDVKSVKILFGESDSLLLLATCGDTELIATTSSIARDIVNDLYGGSVIVPVTFDANKNVTGSTPQRLYLLTEEYYAGLSAEDKKKANIRDILDRYKTSYKSIDLTYGLMNNTFEVYQIAYNSVSETYQLEIAAGKNPADYVRSVLLNVTVVFTLLDNTTATETMQLDVDYSDSGGSNINEFLPYYTYYNDLLYSTIAGYTIKSFTMPFCYGNGQPIICYDIGETDKNGGVTLNRDGALSMSLYYNGAIRTTFTASGTTYTAALDSYLASAGVSLSTIVAYGDAKWVFGVDTDKIGTENTTIQLIYNYKSNISSLNWTTYKDSSENYLVGSFVLAGVLRYKPANGDSVHDENFYKWIYDNFNPDSAKVAYTTGGTEYLTKIVYTDWLKQNVTVDRGASTLLQGVTDFAGLQYLIGTKKVDLSGASLSGATIAGYISKMVALETLILSNNAFSDRDDAASGDNGSISLFSSLKNLKTLWIDNNVVYSFEWLLSVPSLSKVYLYNNHISGVNGIFYGSKGLANYTVFQQLTENGISVYNTVADTTPILFEKSEETNDYINLKGLEYQSRLKNEVDIYTLCSSFSTTLSDYGIDSSYTDSDGNSYTASNQTLTWWFIGDRKTTDTFTLTYSLTLGGTAISVTIKFRITRF